MTILRRVLYVCLLGGLIWAGVQFVRGNETPLQVDLLVVEPLTFAAWKVLLGAFALGAVLAVLISLLEVTRYAFVARRYRRAAARLEREVHQLRNLPLSEDGLASGADEPDFAASSGGQAPGHG
jgi:uncharacterized integral membrane protein